MIVSDTSVKNRISVVVFSIILLIAGVYCYVKLPRESAPDITIPHVFVSTDYKGVSSSDIETSITIPIEKKLKGLDRVKKIHSISSEGISMINVEFIPGTDIDEVLQKVKDKVDEAKRDLPHDLEDDPSVFEVNFSELPIVVYSISGDCGLTCLKKIADDLEEDIESIPGVLEVEVTGGLEREIKIEVDPDKLAFYRIPITLFQKVVTSENQNTSGGAITLGDGRYQLRVPGEFSSPDEITGLVVNAPEGEPIYLKDLAKVTDGFKDETSRSRLDGREAVSITIKKRVGENIISICDRIDELIGDRKAKWPKGTQITKLMDQAKDIRLMVSDLENNILSGLVLVIAVLFVVMGFRNAVLVSLAIPFSMFLSFIVLYVLGITLNMVVLFSLTLALGMLVDNAIVIIENIYRYMEQGVPRIPATMRATSEVAYPVIGSTLTTLVAFFPMIFWPGIMGEFMKYLPITLIVTLSSSLFVALVINPALAAFFIRVKGKPVDPANGMTADQLQAAGEKPAEIRGFILRFYTRFLAGALNHRGLVILISFSGLILFFMTWVLTIGLEKPVEFFPDIDPKSIYVNIDTPEGADLEYIDRIVRQTEITILGNEKSPSLNGQRSPGSDYETAYLPRKHRKSGGSSFSGPGDMNNVEHVYAKSVEVSGPGDAFSSNLPTHIAVQFIELQDRTESSRENMEQIRDRVRLIPGAKITVAKQEEGPPTGSPINIEISGNDFQVLGELARKIRSILDKLPHVSDVRDDYVEGIPTIQVKIDRQKAALFNLSTNTIGFALKTAYNGLDISTFREGDEDYDISVILENRDRSVLDVLYKLMIPAPSGHLVPLTTLASIDDSGSLGNISRINHDRVVTVKAEVDETKIPGPVARQRAEDLLREFPLPAGYQVKFTGEFEFQKEAEEFLSKAFAMAVFLIFLVLVTQFNSVIQPGIIMTSVILSLGGAFLGLTLLNAPFGIIMTGVGVVSLAGVVVNNAIILIDYTNKLRDRGMAIHDAVVAAGATRLRPVFLTAITTTLGLIPMVTGVSFDFHNMSMAYVSE
ncbi:MAG: efflux RND transporter permease subunit, partial [Thermodesulfobacteriota bacterium]